MLGLLSIFSLDFLALECLQQGSPAKRFFTTVYLWSLLPLLLCFLIVLVGVMRIYIVEENLSLGKKQAVVNQHLYTILLLTYCVLPPVANKQLQSLDCLPLNKEGINFLRVDSKISCDSYSYRQFKSIMICFIVLYQSIPICWMVLLYQYKQALYSWTGRHDEKLALYIRDRNRSLDKIRFLFNDYRTPKWWFEVAEMYRRIVFVGVLPLTSTVVATRASFGCVLAMISVAYFREERPYRYRFTNFIAYVAQVAILVTFYAALSIETGVMMDFGLGGTGMGIFLVLTNLVIFGLLLYLGVLRFRKEQHQRNAVILTASRTENATNFSAEKFLTTFTAISHRLVPASHVLLFHYTSPALGRMARRSGIAALKCFDGIAFTLRCPHHTAPVERYVFSDSNKADSWDGSAFPNQEVIVVALPRHLLDPLPGYDDDPCLCYISSSVLEALRATRFATVLDNSPWLEGVVMLPPQCILRSYALHEEDIDTNRKKKQEAEEDDKELLMKRKQWIFEEQREKKKDIKHINFAEQFLSSMETIREEAEDKSWLPLYHYTSPDVLPLIMKFGLRMSTQGQGDGGVYFSTRGPIAYGLGKPLYEDNIIKDCFGVERLAEYKGKGKLDAVIVYGCERKILLQAPGGRDHAKMIPRSTFNDIMLPQFDGSYFLRPDRILGCFIMNHVRLFPLTSTIATKPRVSQFALKTHQAHQASSPSSPTSADKKDMIMESCISEVRSDKESMQSLDILEIQSKLHGAQLAEISNSLLPHIDTNEDDDDGEVVVARSRSRSDSIVQRLSESVLFQRAPNYQNDYDSSTHDNSNVRFSDNPLFQQRERGNDQVLKRLSSKGVLSKRSSSQHQTPAIREEEEETQIEGCDIEMASRQVVNPEPVDENYI